MTDILLLENGSALLLETGSYFLLEVQTSPDLFKRIILTRSPSDFIIKSRNQTRYLLNTQERITIRRTT